MVYTLGSGIVASSLTLKALANTFGVRNVAAIAEPRV
jgi:hypothetical protein